MKAIICIYGINAFTIFYSLNTQQIQPTDYRASDPQEQWAQEFIAKIKPIQSNDFILDVGCGTGTITIKHLSPKVPSGYVIGIDNNEKNITFPPVKQLPTNVILRNRGIGQIASEDMFDIIFSSLMFHWIKDLKPTIEKIHTALRSNGKGYFLVAAEQKNNLFLITEENVTQGARWKDIFANKPLALIKNYLFFKKIGELSELLNMFKCQSIDTVDVTYTFNTLQELIKWFSKGPAQKYLSKSVFDEYCNDLAATYAQLTGQDLTGPIVYKDVMLHIIVTK